MTTVRRVFVSIASLIAIIVLLFSIWGASPRTEMGSAPVLNPNDRVRLDHGFVVLEHNELLQARQPTALTLRIWVQQLPSYYPFLTVRGAMGESRIGPIDVQLPPSDGTFHMIELPWWRVPVNTERVHLKLTGHGVLVKTTTPSDMRPRLEVNGVARPEMTLATQMISRHAPLEYFLPVLQIAEGKPGLLGYPQLVLLLGLAFCAIWGVMFFAIPYLLRGVLQAHVAILKNQD